MQNYILGDLAGAESIPPSLPFLKHTVSIVVCILSGDVFKHDCGLHQAQQRLRQDRHHSRSNHRRTHLVQTATSSNQVGIAMYICETKTIFWPEVTRG